MVTQHRFAGLEHQLSDDGLAYVAWRGTCACGHEGSWSTDKDAAWEAAGDHFLTAVFGPALMRGVWNAEE